MIVDQILRSVYITLGNIGEEELDYIIALEMLRTTYAEMRMEEILGYRNEIISVGTLTYNQQDEVPNTLPNFATEVIFCRLNNIAIQEIPPNLIDEYRIDNRQAVSFFSKNGTKVAKLVFKTTGTLEVWYEPISNIKQDLTTRDLGDVFEKFLVIRTAQKCLAYVNYRDPMREQKRMILDRDLIRDAQYAKDLWKERVNRISLGAGVWRKRPFRAGLPIDKDDLIWRE